ncbi:MAG: flavodoxin [Treponema sp.]|nr:MAG: flavodoxin [Treponema sp.]
MKLLVTYSSKTGNTEKVGKAIFEVMPEGTDFLPMSKVENIDAYDKIILGCWIDKGLPNEEALKFIDTLKNKQVGYFFTLGAYPDSEHANNCYQRITDLLVKNGNTVTAKFGCQGKIDPALTKRFMDFPKDHPHYMDEERRKRHEEAAKHPDQNDFQQAQKIFKNFLK